MGKDWSKRRGDKGNGNNRFAHDDIRFLDDHGLAAKFSDVAFTGLVVAFTYFGRDALHQREVAECEFGRK